MWLKIHVNGLFTCHVVSWKRISPNRVGDKLFPCGKLWAMVVDRLVSSFEPVINKGNTHVGCYDLWYRDLCWKLGFFLFSFWSNWYIHGQIEFWKLVESFVPLAPITNLEKWYFNLQLEFVWWKPMTRNGGGKPRETMFHPNLSPIFQFPLPPNFRL